MHPTHIIRQIYAAAVTACLFSSCIYDYDNCPERIAFTIVNDWSGCSYANPDGMAYIFFSNSDGDPWRYDFPGMEAGKISLPEGNYSFISYNDDTSGVYFKENRGYGGYTAYCRECDLFDGLADSKPARSSADEPVVRCPSMMWGCAYWSFDLTFGMLSYIPHGTPDSDVAQVSPPEMRLIAHQKPLVAHYTCDIQDVTNLGGVSRLRASMSGMSDSLNLTSGHRSALRSTLPFAARATDSNTIRSEFHTFGPADSPACTNILNLYVWLTDGRRFNYEFDVSDQVRSAPDPMNVYIRLRGLDLPESDIGGSGGFGVSVDGWTTVVINITT